MSPDKTLTSRGSHDPRPPGVFWGESRVVLRHSRTEGPTVEVLYPQDSDLPRSRLLLHREPRYLSVSRPHYSLTPSQTSPASRVLSGRVGTRTGVTSTTKYVRELSRMTPRTHVTCVRVCRRRSRTCVCRVCTVCTRVCQEDRG